MDRLVKADVGELELSFKKGQKCNKTFRLTNLMHTMSVAVSLTTTNPSLFSFNQPFSIIPPLSSASFTLVLSQKSDQPPLAPPDLVHVQSSVLPTGKASQEELRRLFSRHGSHIFRDASIPICFVGLQVIQHLISNPTRIIQLDSFLEKAISGCSKSQLTSLLESAVVSGNSDLVSTLIDHGGDLTQKCSDGRSSLVSAAVRSGNIDMVKVLIAFGCKKSDSNDKVLHLAAEMNRVDLMEVLIANYKNININSVDSRGRTPIHTAAIHGFTEVIQFCLSNGSNSEATDTSGSTPLHLAAENGHFEASECLLESSGYLKYALTKQGKTAFVLAKENGHSNLYDLLRLGDDLNRAARVGDESVIKSCLEEGARVNGKDQNGWTPLHRAAFKGRIESVKALLSSGAEVDVCDASGYTPLHCAVEAGQVQVALLLIAHGAKATAKSLEGVMPLNLERFKSRPSMFGFSYRGLRRTGVRVKDDQL